MFIFVQVLFIGTFKGKPSEVVEQADLQSVARLKIGGNFEARLSNDTPVSNMAEAVAQQMARLQAEMQNLQAQVQSRTSATKDMTPVASVPRWAGNHKAIPLNEFFEIIESTAKIGNWASEDKIRVAALKLTDAARALYNGTSELHFSSITWAAFKQVFPKRFRDVRSDQFHFTQIQNAKQNKHETPQEFADRIRALAQRTIPQVDDPEAKKLYQEQADRMALASFTAGFAGVPGRQVRYIMPTSLDEAIRVAITVSQAEVQERQNEVFYAEEARECVTARSSRGARGKGHARNATLLGQDARSTRTVKGRVGIWALMTLASALYAEA
jgi:hypothetical protein